MKQLNANKTNSFTVIKCHLITRHRFNNILMEGSLEDLRGQILWSTVLLWPPYDDLHPQKKNPMKRLLFVDIFQLTL